MFSVDIEIPAAQAFGGCSVIKSIKTEINTAFSVQSAFFYTDLFICSEVFASSGSSGATNAPAAATVSAPTNAAPRSEERPL